MVHLNDPRQAIHQAERMLQDKIDAAVAQRLHDSAAQTAEKVAPQAADARERELLARYGQNHKPAAIEPLAIGSGANGHGAPKPVTRLATAKRGARAVTSEEDDADPT
jgi:hypothetical protein